jgi:heme/copper-type cytochrome/quinol oxidase subunit 3
MTDDTSYLSAEQLNKEKASRMLMWLGIASMVIFFGGLTSAYIVRMNGGNWKEIPLPPEFYISTALILFSSVSMNAGLSAVKKGKPATFALGLGFAISQFLGWRSLNHSGVYFTGRLSIASGQYLYVLTWAHLMHMAGGLISLIVVTVRTSMGKYTQTNYNGMRICSIFWHFLDFLWIYLFLFLLFVRFIA